MNLSGSSLSQTGSRSFASPGNHGRGSLSCRERRWPLLLALLLLVLPGCVTEPDLKHRHDTLPPATGDGWAVSSPAAEGFDDAGLAQAIDLFYSETDYLNAVSLLVARNGKLVVEAYSRSQSQRDRKRHIQSAAKSMTSLVFGIARDQGYFPDLDRTLYSIMPEKFDADDRKREITLRHLLTMKSGIAFYNDDFSDIMLIDKPRDQARYILARPLYNVPGLEFRYRDADPQLVSSAVERVAGKTLEAIAREHVFSPLGIENYYWEANVDGTSLGAYGLVMRPRDLAKIGQLVLDRGRWNDEQLISEEWIDLSTSTQSETDDDAFGYGYYWWIVPEIGGFTAWGRGGNFVLVVPGDGLVVTMTSLPHTDEGVVGTSLRDFLPLVRLIIGATRPQEARR